MGLCFKTFSPTLLTTLGCRKLCVLHVSIKATKLWPLSLTFTLIVLGFGLSMMAWSDILIPSLPSFWGSSKSIGSSVVTVLLSFVSFSTSSIKNIFGSPYLWPGPHLPSHLKQSHLSLFFLHLCWSEFLYKNWFIFSLRLSWHWVSTLKSYRTRFPGPPHNCQILLLHFS